MNPLVPTRLSLWLRDPLLRVVLVDADDTLWHDSRYFRRLEDELRSMVERTGADATTIGPAIRRERTNWGGGESAFAESIRSVGRTLLDTAGLSSLETAVQAFLAHPVEVLPLADAALDALRPFQRVLLTKGVEVEQRRKVDLSGLAGRLDAVLVLEHKNPRTFAEVLQVLGAGADEALVIGNSVTHDIGPAIANSVRAVWLNHAENQHGRNGPLPSGALEVGGWEAICAGALNVEGLAPQ